MQWLDEDTKMTDAAEEETAPVKQVETTSKPVIPRLQAAAQRLELLLGDDNFYHTQIQSRLCADGSV